jgi:hypothetical protein
VIKFTDDQNGGYSSERESGGDNHNSRPVMKFEIWGRRKIGKGPRRKLAYGISNESDAKAKRAHFTQQGYDDCIVAAISSPDAPDIVVGGARAASHASTPSIRRTAPSPRE